MRSVPQDCPQAIVDLWWACTRFHPSARPSAAEVYAALDGQLRVLQFEPLLSAPVLDLPATFSSVAGALRQSTLDTAYAPRIRAEAADLLDTVRALRKLMCSGCWQASFAPHTAHEEVPCHMQLQCTAPATQFFVTFIRDSLAFVCGTWRMADASTNSINSLNECNRICSTFT